LIPVQNIYYLLSYAWNNLEEAESVFVDQDDFESLIDLYATVFANGCHKLLRRGLHASYQEHTESIRAIKGKLNLSESLKNNSLALGIASCTFDEFTSDTLPNQIIKKTCAILIKTREIKKDTRSSLRDILNRLHHVSDIRLHRSSFSRIRLNRNDAHYHFVLKVCHLIMDNIRLHQSTGTYEFIDFIRNEKKMARIFESFLLQFYRHKSSFKKVKSEKLHWNAQVLEGTFQLPQMLTDISLISNDRKIIIDAKYYKEALQKYYDKQKIKSSHLYQLYAYLKNDVAHEGRKSEGVLLYPTVHTELSERFLIDGHAVTIATINLDQDWRMVESDLLDLIK